MENPVGTDDQDAILLLGNLSFHVKFLAEYGYPRWRNFVNGDTIFIEKDEKMLIALKHFNVEKATRGMQQGNWEVYQNLVRWETPHGIEEDGIIKLGEGSDFDSFVTDYYWIFKEIINDLHRSTDRKKTIRRFIDHYIYGEIFYDWDLWPTDPIGNYPDESESLLKMIMANYKVTKTDLYVASGYTNLADPLSKFVSHLEDVKESESEIGHSIARLVSSGISEAYSSSYRGNMEWAVRSSIKEIAFNLADLKFDSHEKWKVTLDFEDFVKALIKESIVDDEKGVRVHTDSINEEYMHAMIYLDQDELYHLPNFDNLGSDVDVDASVAFDYILGNSEMDDLFKEIKLV